MQFMSAEYRKAQDIVKVTARLMAKWVEILVGGGFWRVPDAQCM